MASASEAGASPAGLPLARYRVFASRDVDEARELVARIFCPHELAPADGARELDACHHHALLHRETSLNYVQYGPAVRIEPGCLGAFHLLQIPLRGGATVRCGATWVESDRTMASFPSPTEPLSMRWQADSPQLIVKLGHAALQQRLEALLQAPAGRALVFEPAANLATAGAQGVLGFIAHLRHALDADAGLLAQGFLAEQAESHLLTSVLLSLRHNYTQRLAQPGPRPGAGSVVLPGVVSRAQAYMRAHAQAPLSLADVCGHVGVSARALQMSFQRCLGLSPMVFLRQVRLDLVRHELLGAGDAPVGRQQQVRAAAFRHGFLHLGHFAAHYRARFGEAPSTTLQRGRARHRV